jgi:hypothetical protein
VTALQRCLFWLLRTSHRWEWLAMRCLGRRVYGAIRNLVWRLYVREATRRTKRKN